ncbi:hypothetical protein VTI74DRAFT_8973 [Chaetomium olivicolor]
MSDNNGSTPIDDDILQRIGSWIEHLPGLAPERAFMEALALLHYETYRLPWSPLRFQYPHLDDRQIAFWDWLIMFGRINHREETVSDWSCGYLDPNNEQ